ncbi:hypothetical protein GCM10010196_30690 [Agromyces mediolanus]|uniref:Uncharacterized protein n=1 Tax=Agromyces mediolanus TaxID=41986 RepID=A0A918CPW5_AGRME|nr:hypothetical protein GCM10010196_30690 [Agromyces mediolanus]
MFGSVTVNGRPASSCETKSGITEPREYMTLPYRVTEMTVSESRLFLAIDIAVFSMSALLIPIALIG